MGGLVGLNGEKKGMRGGREDARLAEKVEELGRMAYQRENAAFVLCRY